MSSGRTDQRWRRADQPANERAQACCAAMTFEENSLALAGDQDQLIDAVAAANPRTVVVLNTGGPVLMPWLDQVGAVVQAWLPGQQFGQPLFPFGHGLSDSQYEYGQPHLEHEEATGAVTVLLQVTDVGRHAGAEVVHQGRHEVLVGRSSRDIRGRAGFEVGARTPVGP